MKATPTGLVPDEDVAQIMISIDSKPGSSLSETNRIVKIIDKRLAEYPELEYSSAVSGYSFNGAGPSMGMYFIKMTDWDKRKGKGQSAAEVSQRLYEIFAFHGHSLRSVRIDGKFPVCQDVRSGK